MFFPGHPLVNVPSKTAAATLLTIGDESATVGDFVDYLNIVKIRNAEAGANTVIDEQLGSWTDKLLLDYEDARLEAKHDDFRLLMEEYHDGILLLN